MTDVKSGTDFFVENHFIISSVEFGHNSFPLPLYGKHLSYIERRIKMEFIRFAIESKACNHSVLKKLTSTESWLCSEQSRSTVTVGSMMDWKFLQILIWNVFGSMHSTRRLTVTKASIASILLVVTLSNLNLFEKTRSRSNWHIFLQTTDRVARLLMSQYRNMTSRHLSGRLWNGDIDKSIGLSGCWCTSAGRISCMLRSGFRLQSINARYAVRLSLKLTCANWVLLQLLENVSIFSIAP